LNSEILYLDNAATSFPKPESVYQALNCFLRTDGANPGRAGHRMAVRAEKFIEETRLLLARFFGVADHTQVIFTLNATDSLNIGIKGSLKPGDHVITSLLEHNSVSRPLKQLERDGRIGLTQIAFSEDGFVDPPDIQKAIRPNTRLIVLTHASNVLGTVQPIREVGRIAREHDLLFMVDAAQTAGVVPIAFEELQIDMLAMPGHKALMGPTGVGVLIVGKRADLSAWREGGTGGDSSNPVQPGELPYRLEGGTPNTVGIAGLRAGVEFVLQQGVERIRQHENQLVNRLIHALGDNPRFHLYGTRDLERRVATQSLNVNGYTAAEVSAILDEAFQIAVRSGLHCAPYVHRQLGLFPEGAVRISIGYFNTADDIDRCTAALREMAA
jgi:cysteine desulfurase/selenocysteine lyase